jgi:hypothetical protein
LRLLPQPGLLLQLLPQLSAGVAELLQRLVQLGFNGSLGVLELLRVPEFSLHKLVLQLSGDFLLSVQGLAVLKDELILFICNLEEGTVNRKKPVDSRSKINERENGTFEPRKLGGEVLKGDFRKRCCVKIL